jgi:hypothetical protein
MKRLLVLAERKSEPYSFGAGYPSLMFWLITVVVLLQCVLGVQIIIQYHTVLDVSILTKAVILLLMFLLTWAVYYRLHRFFQKLVEESPPSNERVVKKGQALFIAFALGTYIIFGFCLSILRNSLEELHH